MQHDFTGAAQRLLAAGEIQARIERCAAASAGANQCHRAVDDQVVHYGHLSAFIERRVRIQNDSVQHAIGVENHERRAIGTVDRAAVDPPSIEPPVRVGVLSERQALVLQRATNVDRRVARAREGAQVGQDDVVVQIDSRVGRADRPLIDCVYREY